MGGNPRISSYNDARESLMVQRSSTQAFTYSEEASRSGRGTVHANLNPKGQTRECLDTAAMPNVTPIAIAMDVTKSRGKDAKVIYEQTMRFLGALYLANTVRNPQILFAAFGASRTAGS